LMQPW
jgi:Putative GTPases (G3E family)